jgi:hypothetical protein
MQKIKWKKVKDLKKPAQILESIECGPGACFIYSIYNFDLWKPPVHGYGLYRGNLKGFDGWLIKIENSDRTLSGQDIALECQGFIGRPLDLAYPSLKEVKEMASQDLDNFRQRHA